MSNDYNDIDAVLSFANDAHNQRMQEEAEKQRLEEEKKNLRKKAREDEIFRMAERAIKEEIWRNSPPKIVDKPNQVMSKSLGKPKISLKLARTVEEIKDTIRDHKIATALVAAALILFLAVSGPTLKANSQVSNLQDQLGEEFEKNNYTEKQNTLFSKTKLTIEPEKFINNLGLTSESHTRLYILSTVIQDSDFENILQALGYRNKEDYLKKLGFEHNELRASEQYDREYEKKLQEMIKELNNNPELVPSYLEKYPELRLIYEKNNTYLIDGKLYTTEEELGRSK